MTENPVFIYVLIIILIIFVFLLIIYVINALYDFVRFYSSNTLIPLKLVRITDNIDFDIENSEDFNKIYIIEANKDLDIDVSINILYKSIEKNSIKLISRSPNHTFVIYYNDEILINISNESVNLTI